MVVVRIKSSECRRWCKRGEVMETVIYWIGEKRRGYFWSWVYVFSIRLSERVVVL